MLLIFVVVSFSMVAVMLLSHFFSVASVAQERKLGFDGQAAVTACRNALNEGFYHFISRANSPRLSAQAEVDVYDRLRELEPGMGFSYQVAPSLTRRVMRAARARITKVEVEVQAVDTSVTQDLIQTPVPIEGQPTPPESIVVPQGPDAGAAAEMVVLQGPGAGSEDPAAPSSAGGAASNPTWPAPDQVNEGGASGASQGDAGWQGRPGAGAPSQICTLISFEFRPRTSVIGVASFTVTAEVDGPRAVVRRTVQVRKGFTVIDVSAGSDLALVRLSPNDIASFVDRQVEAK